MVARYSPFHRMPHSKAIVSQPNRERFAIYFPESRRWLSLAATPRAFTLAILCHFRGVSVRLALWSQLPATKFFERLLDVESSGVTLVCCYEHHAVLLFHAWERVERTRLSKGVIVPVDQGLQVGGETILAVKRIGRLAVTGFRSGPVPPDQNLGLSEERVDPPDRQVVLSPEEETVEMACGEVAESFW